MPRLTKTIVEGISPSDKPIWAWDDETRGFGVKVLPSGKRNYYVKYRVGGGRRAQQRWYLIGQHGVVTAQDARKEAIQVLAAVGRGEDPQGQKASYRSALTMKELWERFETDHLSRRRAATRRNYKHLWRLHIERALGAKKVADVTHNDIERLHKRLAKTPHQANRAVAVLSKMFNTAERWGIRPTFSNPCRHIEKYPEAGRTRYLTSDEIEALGESLREGLEAQTETPQMVAAIELLLLTGARVSEILTAKWEWVDWDRHLLRLPDSKTGPKPIFLSNASLDVLRRLKKLPKAKENPYIIAGRLADSPLDNLRKPWRRVRARAGLDDVRLHDLRHTAASIAVGQGMSLPVIGRLLGHTQPITTQRYAHVDVDPALAAAEQIGTAVTTALGSTASGATDPQTDGPDGPDHQSP